MADRGFTRRRFLYGSAAAAVGVTGAVVASTSGTGARPAGAAPGNQRSDLARALAFPLFGAAVTAYPGTGRNHAEEVAAHEADCGPMGMLRTFDGGQPLDWFHRSSANGSRVPSVPGWERRASWHSMKPPAEQVARGNLDQWITDYVESIPVTGVPRFLTMWHEPEGKVGRIFPAATWKRAAYRFGQRVRDVGHPDVWYGPVFMSQYTLGNDSNHVPAIMASDPVDLFAVCDFVGWDPYHEASRHGDYGPRWEDPAFYFDTVLEWTRDHTDLPVAFGETGFIPDPENLGRRPAWLTAVADYVESHGVLACCYFDASVGRPWWLRCVHDPDVPDPGSIAAWSQVYERNGDTSPGQVTFVGSAVDGGNTTDIALAWPAAVQVGDTAILRWTHSNDMTPTSGSPAGFTHHETFDGAHGSHRSSLWSRVCTGAESGELRLSLSAINRQSANLVIYRGLHADPVDTWAVMETPTSTSSHPCARVVTGYDDCVIVVGYGERVGQGSTNITPPAGYVERADTRGMAVGNGGTTTATSDDGLRVTRTANTAVTPPNVTSAVASDNAVTWTISLRPATA